jgi:hypothetical protein
VKRCWRRGDVSKAYIYTDPKGGLKCPCQQFTDLVPHKTTRQEVFNEYEKLVNIVNAVISSDEDVQTQLMDLAFAIVDPNGELADIHESEVFQEKLVETESQIMMRVFAELIKKQWWPFGDPALVATEDDQLEVNSGMSFFTKEAVNE